jgi:hypothetical protein
MPNMGGFSWKRALGVTRAKQNLSRKIGVPLTKSGRQRKIGKMVTIGDCLLPVILLALIALGFFISAVSNVAAQSSYTIYLPIVMKQETDPTPLPQNKIPRGEGTWLVGSEVAIGHWRNNGGDCYATTQDSNGNLLEFEDGPWAIIRVNAGAYSVKFVNYPGTCTWSFVGLPTTPVPATSPAAPKGEATWLVGSEAAVGNWRNSGADCYAITEDYSGTLLELESGLSAIIRVASNAYLVKFINYPGTCTWAYLGP